MMLGFGFSNTRVFLPLCHMILKKFLNFSKPQNDDNNDIYLTGMVLGKTRGDHVCKLYFGMCSTNINFY